MTYAAISLETFIDKRDFDAQSMTTRFFDIIRDPLTEAAKRITGLDREYDWVSVERTPGTGKYVNIRGYISLKTGDHISVGGEKVLINEDNIDKYNNSFYATVALSILQTLNTDKIYEHIKFTLHVCRNYPADIVLEMLEQVIASDIALIVAPEHQQLLEKMTRPHHVGGFSTDGLSEDQLTNLQLTINTHPHIIKNNH